MIFTNKGNCYKTVAGNLPELKWKEKGKIKMQVKNKANQVKKGLKNRKVGLKTKFFFKLKQKNRASNTVNTYSTCSNSSTSLKSPIITF